MSKTAHPSRNKWDDDELPLCTGPCHNHNNVFCLDRCCPECKTRTHLDD